MALAGLSKGLNSKKDDEVFTSLEAVIGKLWLWRTGSPYGLTANHLRIDSKKEWIAIQSLHLQPRYDKLEMGRVAGHQVDYIASTLNDLTLWHIPINKLLHETVLADELEIKKSTTYIFRDRRLPRPMNEKPLPVALLKRFPDNIRIHKVIIENSTIRYEEMPKAGGHSGILDTRVQQLILTPLVNHPRNNDPQMITVHMSGTIMESGQVHAEMEWPLRGQTYRVKGAIQNLELTSLNSGAENLGNIRIKSGLLDSLGFDFSLDDNKATGKIVGIYHHLILQQLKQDKNGRKKVNFLHSFALRHLIIPLNKDRSLPEKKRTGAVDYKRDPSRFISYYLLQALLTGIKSSFSLGFLLPK